MKFIGFFLMFFLSACQFTPVQKIWYWEAEESPVRYGRVVLVGGCFDVFHYGHLSFLKAAKAQGDYLVLALESDETIKVYKKRTPIHTVEQRAEILATLSIVDEVVILPHLKGYNDYFRFVQSLHPDVIAVTEGDPQLANKQKQIESLGGKVVVVNTLIPVLSTTQILRKSC